MVDAANKDRVNHGGPTSRKDQASHCSRCCALLTTEVDGQPCISEYTQRQLGVTGVSKLDSRSSSRLDIVIQDCIQRDSGRFESMFERPS